jgi:hypothetical protein
MKDPLAHALIPGMAPADPQKAAASVPSLPSEQQAQYAERPFWAAGEQRGRAKLVQR